MSHSTYSLATVNHELVESFKEHIMIEFAYAYTNIDPLIETSKIPIKLKWALQATKPEIATKFNTLWPHALESFLEGCATMWEDDYGITKVALKARLNKLEPEIRKVVVADIACSKMELIDT